MSTPLDDGQLEAVRRRISSGSPRVGGIRGPPGTGKTTSLVWEIVEAVVSLRERVLMCAGQNSTVDWTLRLLNALLTERRLPDEVIKRTGNLTKSPESVVNRFGTHRREDLMRARVVFTTFHSSFVASGDPILNPNDFDRCVYDETGQATPEQAWMPLILLREGLDAKVSVYGDDKQLLPFSPDFVRETGILGYLARNTPDAVTTLPWTYRLPDGGVDMTSTIWYEGKLNAPPEVRQRRLELRRAPSGPFRDAILPENTLVYLGVNSPECESGLSRDNTGQARVVGNLVREMLSTGIEPSRILVEAPYRPHVYSINQVLRGTNVTCSTVHRTLGSENDITIFATTRSNRQRAWGIAGQPELWNVATSRERMKLIIVGDSGETVSEGTRLTRQIYNFIERNGVIRHMTL